MGNTAALHLRLITPRLVAVRMVEARQHRMDTPQCRAVAGGTSNRATTRDLRVNDTHTYYTNEISLILLYVGPNDRFRAASSAHAWSPRSLSARASSSAVRSQSAITMATVASAFAATAGIAQNT